MSLSSNILKLNNYKERLRKIFFGKKNLGLIIKVIRFAQNYR